MSDNKSADNYRALSEEDVELELKNMKLIDPDVMNEIYKTYSDTVMSIITAAAEQTSDEQELVQIERIKRIINLAPIEERFIRSKDKVWGAQDHILNKNADYFLNKDYSTMIKKDGNQAFLERIIEIIRDRFGELSKEHREFYWKKAIKLLNCVSRYKKLLLTSSKQ